MAIIKMTLNELVKSLANKPTADKMGEQWDNAQAHFTDSLSNPQTTRVKAIIDKYAEHITAYYAYSPFGHDSYSVEVLFADDAIACDCINEYEALP
jgi:hypothetical protein